MQHGIVGPQQAAGHLARRNPGLVPRRSDLQQGFVLLGRAPSKLLEDLVQAPFVVQLPRQRHVALRAGAELVFGELLLGIARRLHQRRQRHAHHLAQRAHVIIGDPLPETALPLVEQRRTVEHAGDGLDGLEIGAPVVQPPDDARVDLRSAERHGYGHPLAKRHAFRHRKGVERLGQRKYDVGIAHGRSRIEKECFQAAEPTGPSGAEPQPQNDGINSVFLRVKLRIIPGKQILPAGSTRSIISNRRRFPNSSSYR